MSHFLTRHATKLIDLNREYACQKNCCAPCSGNNPMPNQHNQVCDEHGCKIDLNDTQGLGLGRPTTVPDGFFDETAHPDKMPPNKCT